MGGTLRPELQGSGMDGLTGGVVNVGMRDATASFERHAARHAAMGQTTGTLESGPDNGNRAS